MLVTLQLSHSLFLYFIMGRCYRRLSVPLVSATPVLGFNVLC